MIVEMTKNRNAEHLHDGDCPETLALLARIVHTPGEEVGYERSDCGAWVDWDRLQASYLSSTEKAAVRIAQGLYMLEHHGGAGPLAQPLIRALSHVV